MQAYQPIWLPADLPAFSHFHISSCQRQTTHSRTRGVRTSSRVHSAIWRCNAQWVIPCTPALIECCLCSFQEYIACRAIKLNMHFSLLLQSVMCCYLGVESGLMHPYPGITLTFRQCIHYPESKSIPSIEPRQTCMLWALVSVNPHELSEWNVIFHVIPRACPTPPTPEHSGYHILRTQ